VARLGAHVAALGMRFYTGTSFPPEYRNNIFIAEHGSWNRSSKVGYRVVRVVLDATGKVTKQEPFAQGWLQDGRAWGRPADVLTAPDGSLLVSDDEAGAVYRIRYIGR
jgi:glucose/arabinose dehydrogenase